MTVRAAIDFDKDLIDAYVNGTTNVVYRETHPIFEYLLTKAMQGYRILPMSSVVECSKMGEEHIAVFCQMCNLTIEPYWNEHGVRLVPASTPMRVRHKDDK